MSPAKLCNKPDDPLVDDVGLWAVSNSGAVMYLHYGLSGGNDQLHNEKNLPHQSKTRKEPFETRGTQLPGECFSPPVALDRWLFVGCRDNFLYCLV